MLQNFQNLIKQEDKKNGSPKEDEKKSDQKCQEQP